MPRHALIGTTVMLTLAVLIAGQEGEPAASDELTAEMALHATSQEASEVIWQSSTGVLQLSGAVNENNVSLTLSFEDSH
ncbi:MAG: hypothetical protein AAF610_10800 [Pseudomonadota bacterium]